MGGCGVFMFFSSAILLKGDFRMNSSHSIRDLCLEANVNKDIVLGNWSWRYKYCLIANHKRGFLGKNRV